MEPDEKNLDAMMQERFGQLPKVVQDAITSAEVEKHLRELANTHKLHLDQWTALENEVMLTLLGLEPIDTLAKNIQTEVGVDAATASTIAGDISNIVFAPIRSELERLLEHPEAQTEKRSDVDQVRDQVLTGAPKPVSAPVLPATPPPPAPTAKVERAQLPASYASVSASKERKTVEGDPYREQIA